jgi:glyoxylase-like metal-dependent hydrolase (beta-lactamase superfamily II)
MKLGDFEIHALSDGSFALDGGQMFGVVPKPLWEKKTPADRHNRIRLGLNCLLVRTGRENVLIETGVGDKYDAKFCDIYDVDESRRLPDQIRSHGLDLDKIDLVINSHLHFDHCGWNTVKEGERVAPAFPRARYFVQRGEWEHAIAPNERDRASYIESFFRPAEAQTTLLDGDGEIVPGLRVQVFPGHTRDLQVIWIESRGERACFISDLVPMSAHVPYPWIMAFDLYPMETLASKRRLLPELVREGTLVVFPHDDQMPWARLVERKGKIEAEAVEVR